MAEVFTLVVEVGRKPGDGLPEGATGAALLCYAAGVDEAEAVREAVAVLKVAEMAPLDVTGYGTLAEREAEGAAIAPEERAQGLAPLRRRSLAMLAEDQLVDGLQELALAVELHQVVEELEGARPLALRA